MAAAGHYRSGSRAWCGPVAGAWPGQRPRSSSNWGHMPATGTALSYDVFVAPEKPFVAPAPAVGDAPAWDPTTSTLIFGARDAVLVDPLMTVREATALADWVALHDRRPTTIYITHGHGDHYLGLPVVLGRFPDARAVATAKTVRHMQQQDAQALDDSLRARRAQGPNPGQPAHGPRRHSRLSRATRGRRARPGPITCNGQPLPILGQPPAVANTRGRRILR